MQVVASLVFLMSLLLVLWVLVGYPLWLGWMARRVVRRPLLQEETFEPTVTVLLPVYNGEQWVAVKLNSLLALDYPREKIQIVVISDGSTDQTVELARAFPDPKIEVLEIPRGGKPAALNAGLARAKGEILFFTDVRQTLAPDSLRRLANCFLDPAVGVASGELMIRKSAQAGESSVGLYWTYEKWIRKRLSQLDSVPGATGAIYAMRRNLVRPLPDEVLLDDVYLPLLAFFQGYRVIFEELALAFDDPTSLPVEFTRKVRTRAGVYQIIRFFPELLGRQNRMRFHFLSHKLGRLALPFAFLGIAGSSFGMPEVTARILLGGQALFYGLGLADPVVPEGWRLKRITAPIRTFVTLLAAALFATSILFRPTRNFWKEATRTSASP